MPRLLVVVVSTRPGRASDPVWKWFLNQARQHGKFEIDLVDLRELNLPMFNETKHPRFGQYEHDHTKAWSARVKQADAVVFVTPEYNYSAPPSLLNALDYLVQEWAYKPCAFVAYGGVAAGTRSIQMAKLTVTALKMMPMVEAVLIPMFTMHIDANGVFTPPEGGEKAATTMLDELLRWTNALAVLRS